MTPHQMKEALKPDKNRNHFKRMWKKDLQIKVYSILYAGLMCKLSFVLTGFVNADYG